MIPNESAYAIKDAVLAILEADTTIPQERLESFINNKYHWKALTPADQMRVAKELYAYRKAEA